MAIALFLVCAVFTLAGLECFRAAWRGTAAARRALALRRARIADITEGRVELAGALSLGDEAITSPSGKRCAAVKVTMTGREGERPKSRRTVSDVQVLRVAKNVILRDDTGAVELDLEHVEIVAPQYAADGPVDALSGQIHWREHLDGATTYVGISEQVIEDGARVVVYGLAEPMGEELARAEVGEAGYRGKDPKVRRTYRVVGRASDRLVVTDGTERTLLLRAAWPVALLVFAGTVFLGHAAVMAFILTS